MDTKLRSSGIDGFGDVDWGTHFCLFYETKEDLLGILIPYVKAGLENNEFFLCVASPPLSTEEARQAIRESVPNFEQFLAEGQIEIVSYQDWLLTGDQVDAQRVLQKWIAKVNWVLAKGYAGLRFAGDPSWIDKQVWDGVPEFEKQLDKIVRNSQMLGLCAYALERCSAEDVLDVVHHHQFTVVKRNGGWEHLGGSELKRAHDQIRQLNADLEGRVAERMAELAVANEQLRQEATERKQAEEALRQSESNFRTLAEKSLEGIQIYQGGRSVYANAAMTALMGYTQEELRTMSMEEHIVLVHPLDRAIAVERARRRMVGQEVPASLEVRILTKAGATRWIQGFTNEIEYNGQAAIISTAIDITERKQSEEELRTQKEILQKIFDHIPMMIGIIGVDGQWQMINRAWEQTIGWTLEELQQPNFDVLAEVYPDAQEQQRVMDFIAAKSGKWEEFKARARDGRALDVTFTNVYLSDGTTLGFGLDITERKRAEQALRKSERVLREAESLGHTGSWEQNLVTGEIFNTEENLRLFFGDDRSKGANFEDYAQAVHPDDHEYVLRRRAKLLEEEGPSDIEYRVIWPDRSIHVIFGRATVVRNELGQAIRVYGTNVDITERKQAEEAVLLHSARLQLLAAISHSFSEAGLDYHSVLTTVAQRTAELIGDSCVITLFSDDGQRSFPVAFHHPNPKALTLMRDGLLHSWQGGTDTERFGTLLSGESVYIPVVNPEEYRASSEPEFWPYIDNIGISSVLIVPLQVQGRVIGTLGITRDQAVRPYMRDDQVLLQDVADRAALAIENARLFEAVSEHRQQLIVLSARLAETQESERRQLALELHDEFGQSLTYLKMDLAWLNDHLPPRSKSLREKLDSALDLTNETIRMTQRLASQLRPRMLDDLGLAAALEWHVNEWSKRARIKTKVNLPDEEWQLGPSLNSALFRVCQEALTNVARHAGASKVEVSLAREGDEIVLTVRDNGHGIDRAKITAPESLGLLGMKERVEQIGGRLEIQSEAGKGSTVVARVPISRTPSYQQSQSALKEYGQAKKSPNRKGSRRRES